MFNTLMIISIICYMILTINTNNSQALLWHLSIHIIATITDYSYYNPDISLHLSNITKSEYIYESQLYMPYFINSILWFFMITHYLARHISKDTTIDSYVMISHHVITISLIVLSFYMQLKRFGIFIMYIHDICDIFVLSLRYAGKRKFSQTIVNVLFVALVSVWTYFRLYLFSYMLLDLTHNLFMESWTAWVGVLGLSLLILMNVYWFGLILRLAFTERDTAVHIYNGE